MAAWPSTTTGAENQLRLVAVGRRNWLFAGSFEGARRAALLYSLVQSCKIIGIPFATYMIGMAFDPVPDLLRFLATAARALLVRTYALMPVAADCSPIVWTVGVAIVLVAGLLALVTGVVLDTPTAFAGALGSVPDLYERGTGQKSGSS